MDSRQFPRSNHTEGGFTSGFFLTSSLSRDVAKRKHGVPAIYFAEAIDYFAAQFPGRSL